MSATGLSGRPAGPRARRRASGTAPSTGRCASSASAPRRSSRSPPTPRGGCGWTRSPPRSTRPTTARRSCARRPATSTPAPSTRSGEISDIAHAAGAWVHVDGAFGLWAAASPRLRPLVAGVERADSWATDAHKWLNVPYDCGLVFCADPQAHRAAMGARAGYLVHGSAGERDALDHNPEFSRRARGFAVYAALRALGRERRRRAGRAQLRAGSPVRRRSWRGPGRRGPERRGAQPGAGPLRQSDGDPTT